MEYPSKYPRFNIRIVEGLNEIIIHYGCYASKGTVINDSFSDFGNNSKKMFDLLERYFKKKE